MGRIEPSLKHKVPWVFYMKMIADHYVHLAEVDAENSEGIIIILTLSTVKISHCDIVAISAMSKKHCIYS